MGRRDPADIESGAAGERVDVVIDVVIADPDDEVSWQPDAVRRDAAPPRHLQPHHGQQDRHTSGPVTPATTPTCGPLSRLGAHHRGEVLSGGRAHSRGSLLGGGFSGETMGGGGPDTGSGSENWLRNRLIAEESPRTCLLYTSPSPRDRTRSRM